MAGYRYPLLSSPLAGNKHEHFCRCSESIFLLDYYLLMLLYIDGTFIRRIGQGKLIGPKGITTTPRGSVIVADNKGNQVLEFSINGRLIRKIQSVKNDKVRLIN